MRKICGLDWHFIVGERSGGLITRGIKWIWKVQTSAHSEETFYIFLAVLGEGMTMEINSKAKLDVELKLAVGPLKRQNILFLVSENDNDEVLLGRLLMK